MNLDQQQKIIQQKMQDAIDAFNSSMPAAEKKMLQGILKIINKLNTSNGQLLNSGENLKQVAALRTQLESAIINDGYLQEVKKFVEAFQQVADLQVKLYASIEKSNQAASGFQKEVIKQAQRNVIEALTGRGIQVHVIDSIQEMLRQNVTAGGSIDDLNYQVAEAMISGDEDGQNFGKLAAYAKTTTIDAINTFNSEYNQALSADLGYEWYRYVGSLMETSREWCIEMVEKEYVHISELPELLKGRVNGKQVAIYPKYKLPVGMIEGTTVSNLISRRGGHRCGHQFYAIPAYLVPAEIRAKIKQ